MADRRIGIGIVGIGWVSHPHIEAFLKNGHCEIVALCSLREEDARAAVVRHGLRNCRIYTDYERMLAQDNLDLVDICSFNAAHAGQGIAAATAGKHLLIEEARRHEPGRTAAPGTGCHWSRGQEPGRLRAALEPLSADRGSP